MVSSVPSLQHRDDEASASKVDNLVKAVLLLLDNLTPLEKQAVLKRLTEALRPIPARNAGDVLGVVIQLLPKTGPWTVEDLKKSVDGSGLEAKPKEIYNAIGYLARRGHIRRVGYGRYVVDGAEIITADDLGGETTRHEDLYREPRS